MKIIRYNTLMEKVAANKNKAQIKAEKDFQIMCNSVVRKFNKLLKTCKYDKRIFVYQNEVRKGHVFEQLGLGVNITYLSKKMNEIYGPFGYKIALRYQSNRYDIDFIPFVTVEFSEK